MYKFVKIREKNTDKSGCWYFVPNSVEQVREHFEKIFGREIKDGVNDKFTNTGHPNTSWRKAVDLINMSSGNHWIVDAMGLENEVLNNRINDFLELGDIYLANGVQQFGYSKSRHEIIDDVEFEILSYPKEEKYKIEDVRYLQWNMEGYLNGEHWYAKIGNEDIRDKEGKMKWNTKEEAEKAAEWFCQYLNWKTTIKK